MNLNATLPPQLLTSIKSMTDDYELQLSMMDKRVIDKSIPFAKWIFNMKRNGIFSARLVECDYRQVPGIDFDEIFDSVLNDVIFKIILIINFFRERPVALLTLKQHFSMGIWMKKYTWKFLNVLRLVTTRN
jgi:hypothetical protein